jgi:preprotein translocase SecF subunit
VPSRLRPRTNRPPATTPADDSPEQPKQVSQRVVTTAVMTFGHNINGRTVQDQVLKVAETKGFRWTEEDVDLSPVPPQPDWIIDDSRGFNEWSVAVNGDEDDVRTVLTTLRDKLADTPVWPSSNKIGGKVAGDTQTLAIAALLTSLIGIIIYIWIRFQRVMFGLAAVVALIHDVLIVLGAIAVSYWLAGVLGFLQIQEFKISLSVVAAILTIIGYSLNDTIVVFDRIREVQGQESEPDRRNVERQFESDTEPHPVDVIHHVPGRGYPVLRGRFRRSRFRLLSSSRRGCGNVQYDLHRHASVALDVPTVGSRQMNSVPGGKVKLARIRPSYLPQPERFRYTSGNPLP